ncbi:hypothetical protein HanIR_Chr08g0389571 [Helianthus annuus]|nr:hypothetical protein HanIR_Chr08g0389571 [Helianthus annuus]
MDKQNKGEPKKKGSASRGSDSKKRFRKRDKVIVEVQVHRFKPPTDIHQPLNLNFINLKLNHLFSPNLLFHHKYFQTQASQTSSIHLHLEPRQFNHQERMSSVHFLSTMM